MTTPSSVEFFTDEVAGGRITPRALIESEGTISLPVFIELLEKKSKVLICRLAGAGWYFNIGFTNGHLVVQRPGGYLSIDAAWCQGKQLPESALVSWRFDALMISFGTHTNHWEYPQEVVMSDPAPPPPEVVTWVRAQEMAPVTFFASEHDFVLRVHSSLQRFEERMAPILRRDFFWDIERSGNLITARRPKREVDVQAAIHAMLIDHMLISNIEVQPEARTSAGSVDFLFSGVLQDGRRCRLCAEFKSAHSADLVSGLVSQLRAYMEKAGTQHGAYCVLDFRGQDFSQPSMTTEALLGRLHDADKATKYGAKYPIKIHWFSLAEE